MQWTCQFNCCIQKCSHGPKNNLWLFLCIFVCLFVYLFVCLSPVYLKKYCTDLHENLWKGWTNEHSIKLWLNLVDNWLKRS